MKDLKEIILEKRVREFKVNGKKVPDKYVNAFNDYLKQIAEQLKTHDRELVKEVCEKIRERYNLDGKPITDAFGDTQYGYVMVSAKDLKQFLDQIQKDIENG